VKLTPYRHPNFDPLAGPPLNVLERGPWLEPSQEARRVIDVDDWAEIRRLQRTEGMPVNAIARRLALSRNTARAALRSDGPPRYERAEKGSIVDVVETKVLELLREFPAMPATVIAERIGWRRSIRVLRERVAELRPLFVPPDPCQRTHLPPGELTPAKLASPTRR
jgi:transposase